MTTKAIINGPVVSKKKLEIIQEHTNVGHNVLGMVHDVVRTEQTEGGTNYELAIGNARVLFSADEVRVGEEAAIRTALVDALASNSVDISLVVEAGKDVPAVDPQYVAAATERSLADLGITITPQAVAHVPQAQMSLDDIVRAQLGLPTSAPAPTTPSVPTPEQIAATVRAQLFRAQLSGGVVHSSPSDMVAQAVTQPSAPAEPTEPLRPFTLTMSVIEPQVEIIQATSLEHARELAAEKRRQQLAVFSNLGKVAQVEVDVAPLHFGGVSAQEHVSPLTIQGGSIASVPSSTAPMSEGTVEMTEEF